MIGYEREDDFPRRRLQEVATTIEHDILSNAQVNGYAGYDPFDSLNSKLFRFVPLGTSKVTRIAWLQFGKRSPVNFRRFLQIPKCRNPKGVGLFVSGLLQGYQRTGEQEFLKEAQALGDWLLGACSDRSTWSHSCWGYHFDWQARAFYVPKGKPNIITTVYIARALFELGEVTEEKCYTDAALDAANFISKHLCVEVDGRNFFAYIPGETTFVHNASLWGAAWSGFAGMHLSDAAMVEQALEVARHSVLEQGDDGSWVYGARHHHQFIDGFHTGYNLEALRFLADAVNTSEFDAAIERGYQYYRQNFFLADGTAKYYNNNVYPIDMHSVAQAIFALLKIGGSEEDFALCEKVLHRSIDLMYLPRKRQFIYQKGRWLSNKINYTRWTQAWAYYAISFYNRYCAEKSNATN